MVGLLGGTFDPVHLGHLDLARVLCDRYALRELWLIPARQNPLKTARPAASADQRLELLRLSLAECGDKRFHLCDWEVKSPGPSFTLSTVERFHAQSKEEAVLIVGNEVFQTLPRWHAPKRLLGQVNVAVATRTPDPANLKAVLEAVGVTGIVVDARGRAVHSGGLFWVELVPIQPLPYSSTAIREAWAAHWAGKAAEPAGVTASAMAYIKKNRLYAVTGDDTRMQTP